MSTSDSTTAAPFHVIERQDGGTGGENWAENTEGKAYGAGISIILESTDVPGSGPRLHKHPYPETFIIRRGRAIFTVGTEEIEGRAGQILVVPGDTPHKFRTLGPERFESVNIHANDEFVTEWLE